MSDVPALKVTLDHPVRWARADLRGQWGSEVPKGMPASRDPRESKGATALLAPLVPRAISALPDRAEYAAMWGHRAIRVAKARKVQKEIPVQ
ncbi:hypothetical protein FACS18947_4650 [Bacteroidia bacterium]|nr:hypothetical protein FACS18947_4650 [Bacteroidia bacterium]